MSNKKFELLEYQEFKQAVYENILLKIELENLLEELDIKIDFILNENNVLEEVKTKEILMSLGMIAALTGFGMGAKDISKKISSKVNTPNQTRVSAVSPTVSSVSPLTVTQISNIQKEIENHTNRIKQASNEFNISKSDINSAEKIAIVLNKAVKLMKNYESFQDNVYLHSILVTSLFASTPGSWRSLPLNGYSVAQNVSGNDRWKLFYATVVKNSIQDLNLDQVTIEEIRKECKKWSEQSSENKETYQRYIESVKKIKSVNGSGNIPIAVNDKTAKIIKQILPNIEVKGAKKVSWCGVTIAAILSDFMAKNQEDLDAGKPSGSAFASTFKLYKNYMNSDELVFDYSKMKNQPEEVIVGHINNVLSTLSVITLKGDSEKDYGGHFAIVYHINEDGTFKTLEGNTGGSEGALLLRTRSPKEIRTIVNIKGLGIPSLNDTAGGKTIKSTAEMLSISKSPEVINTNTEN